MIRHALVVLGLAAFSGPVWADTLRVATFNAELFRDGPGLLLRDIDRGGDEQIAAFVDVIAATRPDILTLQGVDYDYGLAALRALNDELAEAGVGYDHLFAGPTNRGLQSGLDLNGDGRLGAPEDAQGFGRFFGQGAMAVLSRYPIDSAAMQDFTEIRWADVPGAARPVRADGALFPDPEAAAAQRLSSASHWVLPVQVRAGVVVQVMTFHASPPVFDGPEDRNGLRNAEEIRLWQRLLDGEIGTPPEGPFVIAGQATLDPQDSDGRHEAIRALLADPRLQDVVPASSGAAIAPDEGHRGVNARDTVDWPRVGRLRVSYVLPSSDLDVVGAGVYWPAAGEAGHDAAMAASRHRLVWVDLRLPE